MARPSLKHRKPADAGPGFQLEHPGLQYFVICRLRTPHYRLDTRDQLTRREWLGDVVVGAAL